MISPGVRAPTRLGSPGEGQGEREDARLVSWLRGSIWGVSGLLARSPRAARASGLGGRAGKPRPDFGEVQGAGRAEPPFQGLGVGAEGVSVPCTLPLPLCGSVLSHLLSVGETLVPGNRLLLAGPSQSLRSASELPACPPPPPEPGDIAVPRELPGSSGQGGASPRLSDARLSPWSCPTPAALPRSPPAPSCPWGPPFPAPWQLPETPRGRASSWDAALPSPVRPWAPQGAEAGAGGPDPGSQVPCPLTGAPG